MQPLSDGRVSGAFRPAMVQYATIRIIFKEKSTIGFSQIRPALIARHQGAYFSWPQSLANEVDAREAAG
jgi:hypothetical protein